MRERNNISSWLVAKEAHKRLERRQRERETHTHAYTDRERERARGDDVTLVPPPLSPPTSFRRINLHSSYEGDKIRWWVEEKRERERER